MEWIEISGGVGERMLRYSLALSRNAQGEDVGVEVLDDVLRGLFPALPHLPERRPGIAGMLRRMMGREHAVAVAPWMNKEVVESLGDEVRDYFDLAPAAIPGCFAGIAGKLQGEDTVAVHVTRRGIDSCRCTPDYYNWAIAGVRQWLGDVRIVVVTDNLAFTRRCLHTDGAQVEWVELPQKYHRYIFHLLRQAGHCIVGDTLEGWWGAWLNASPDKIVVAPKTLPPALVPYYWTVIPVT